MRPAHYPEPIPCEVRTAGEQARRVARANGPRHFQVPPRGDRLTYIPKDARQIR